MNSMIPPTPADRARSAPTPADLAGMSGRGGSSPAPDAGVASAEDPVAEAVVGLDALSSASTEAHVAAFERVHLALTDALATIDGV